MTELAAGVDTRVAVDRADGRALALVHLVVMSARIQVSQMTSANAAIVLAVVQPVVYVAVALGAGSGIDAAAASRVAVGAILTSIWGSTVWSAGGILRRELWWGTLPRVLLGRRKPQVVLFAKSAAAAIWSAAITLVTVVVTTEIVGYSAHVTRPWWFLVGIIFALASASALGLCLASAFLLTRLAIRVAEALMYPVLVAGGMLVPLAMLPRWVSWASTLISFRWVASILDAATVGGPVTVTAVATSAALTVGYGVIAFVLFDYVLRRARERATLEIV